MRVKLKTPPPPPLGPQWPSDGDASVSSAIHPSERPALCILYLHSPILAGLFLAEVLGLFSGLFLGGRDRGHTGQQRQGDPLRTKDTVRDTVRDTGDKRAL